MPSAAQIKGKLKFYSKPYGKQWKWRYQNSGAFFEKEVYIPEELKKRNIEIIDPLYPKKSVEVNKWTPPRRHPAYSHFFPKPKAQDHPLYHEKPAMLFDKTVKFHGGVDQVCLLTKTMPVYNLTEKLLENSKKFTTENEDDMVQNYIRQALAFNPTKEQIKGFKAPKDIKFNIKKEFATPNNQQMSIILENCIRLCNSMIKNNQSILSRKLMQNTSFYTTLQRADDLIHLRRNTDFGLFSKEPLNTIASKDDLEKSVNYKFIDMYPIFPTIDLLSENIYENNNCIGWLDESNINNQFKYIHTILHVNDDMFTNEADLSRLIMFTFGYAHAQAKLNKDKLELNENMELKNPIVLNAISMQNEKLNFIKYQLNTLNLKNNNGIKNIVYIDKDNELYLNKPNLDKLPYPSKKNIQRYAIRKLEYNPDTFKKFKSVILDGVLL